MNSSLPKVLHPVGGAPLLAHVLQACRQAGASPLHVVVGHGREQVQAAFAGQRDLVWVVQPEQLGTGHAVLMCQPALDGFRGDVLVIAGDMPLIQADTLRRLVEVHRREGAALSLATAELADPGGYGRIVRDANGRITAIVEHADCSPEQRRIHEVNISYYCFDGPSLFDALKRVRPNNAKGEYYITDALRILVADGRTIASLPGVPPEDALGVNSPEDLARVECLMQRRAPRPEPAA